MLFSPSSFKPPMLGNCRSCGRPAPAPRGSAGAGARGRARRRGRGSARGSAPPREGWGAGQRGGHVPVNPEKFGRASVCLCVPMVGLSVPKINLIFLFIIIIIIIINKQEQNPSAPRSGAELTAGVKKQLLELMFLPPTPADGGARPRRSGSGSDAGLGPGDAGRAGASAVPKAGTVCPSPPPRPGLGPAVSCPRSEGPRGVTPQQ